MKIKNRSQLDDLSQAIQLWLIRNRKADLLDKYLPLTVLDAKTSKIFILKFCELNGYIPNQKSTDAKESRLGYLASYYKRIDSVFRCELEKYSNYRMFITSKLKNEILNSTQNRGYLRAADRSRVWSYIDIKSKKFDKHYAERLLSYPTEMEHRLKIRIDKIKSKCFDTNGLFIGDNLDRQFIRAHLNEFPEYKVNKDQEGWTNTLNSILSFCIIHKRCPRRGASNVTMKNASEEARLASRLADIRKANRLGKLNHRNMLLFNKIDKFREVNDKTRYDKSKERVSKRCINLDTGKIFKSAAAAAAFYSIKGSISWACLGKSKTAGGYRWAYCDEKGNILKESKNKLP